MRRVHRFAVAYFAVVVALLLSSCQVAYYPYPSWGADTQIHSDPDVQAAMEACKDFSSAEKYKCLEDFAIKRLNPNVCGLTVIFLDDVCLEAVWRVAEDVSICDRIYLINIRPNCYAHFGVHLTPVPLPT